MTSLSIDPQATPVPYGVLAAAAFACVSVNWAAGRPHVLAVDGGAEITAPVDIIAALLPGGDADLSKWTLWAAEQLPAGTPFPRLLEAAAVIDSDLRLSQWLGGRAAGPNAADAFLWSVLRAVPAWNKLVPTGAGADAAAPDARVGDDVFRWFRQIAATPAVVDALAAFAQAQRKSKEKSKDQASYEIGLPGAVEGKIVTRFPPEPSGYLHIGHAKAAMLNDYFAHSYKGRGTLIVRFDDTNPDKEKAEFEASILDDLAALGVVGDRVTYTSNYFTQLEDICRKLIAEGKAYADDTPREEMALQRKVGQPSPNRDTMLGERGVAVFEQMLAGADDAQAFCIRARIQHDDPNGAMRDPVLYRCNRETPHHRTGATFKAYPTYDFACPIVDALEGVTHALRTNEYHDRNPQYAWIADAVQMRAAYIWDYSRLNFTHTVLSKRKLLWLVERGAVAGWDDPRMPTVRGVLRRGLTAPALREYIMMQGPSKNVLLLSWDKLWAVNKRHIDSTAPRHVVVLKEGVRALPGVAATDDAAVDAPTPTAEIQPAVTVALSSGPADAYTAQVPRHKKNLALGEKTTSYASSVLIEQVDAQLLRTGDEVTLMDWGNVIVEEVVRDAGDVVTAVRARLHLEGDFRKTSLKLTWLAPEPQALTPVTLGEYEHVLTKKKLEEGDELSDCVNWHSARLQTGLGDASLAGLNKGDIIQLERKGFFICDRPAPDLFLIAIPDSREK